MNHDEIIALTKEYGGGWAINHARRLLHLISLIDEGLEYDKEAVWLAAYLHDWGGYPKWALPEVEHFERSAEVAREFLAERGCEPELARLVVECIANHHGGDPDRSIESKLFTDADALDLLGACGVLRVFSMTANARNLEAGLAAAKKYRDLSASIISLDRSRGIAEPRI